MRPCAGANQERKTQPRLAACDLALSYGGRVVVDGLTVTIPDNAFTVIIGPNACGKSTLLRGLSRLLRPDTGQVMLDGELLWKHSAREVARRLGLLSQSATAPETISVWDLVARGRFPHQGLLRQWSRADEQAVQEALAATGVSELAERQVDELSGGQRQRVWIAMLLAQQTAILLLDEPTTFLDIAHQVEVLDLCQELRETQGATLVAVLHDLNQACRYATHLIAMREGRIVAEGAPCDIMTESLVEQVFDLRSEIIKDPQTGLPIILPRSRRPRSD